MLIIKRVAHLRDWVTGNKTKGYAIGFVPTMGALHEGHLSLVERSRAECPRTVVSVFVNPTQFNDPEDLKKYPRPIEADIKMLMEKETDVLFLPDVADIYPPGESHDIGFDPGPAAEVMEGRFRPGHFQGMAQVVYRLLDIVTPDRLYMGQKDYQQFAIIRKLIDDFGLPIGLIMCPTVREANGLAMSSRNMRLSGEGRERAGQIYALLMQARDAFEAGEPATTIESRSMMMLRDQGFEPEYFEIIDAHTLIRLAGYEMAGQVIACCAVWVEGVRLIDNIVLRG